MTMERPTIKERLADSFKNCFVLEKPRVHSSIKIEKMMIIDIFLLMCSGICTGLQGVTNGGLTVHISGGFSSWLSFAIGSTLLFFFFIIDTRGGRTINWKNAFKTAPWWCWFGGLPGAAFVVFITILIPHRGSAVVSGVTICSQMVTSLFVDSFALFGANHRPATVIRLAGIALMIAGVLMVALG